MSTNTITKDEKATPKPSDALHFFIYDVLYVAVLGAILYDLLKGPEGDLRRWSIEWSLAVTYVVDCLYTRARLRSFEEKKLKGEDFLNTVIPLAFGYAFSRAVKQEFATTFGVMSLI